jgi:hypothetical protein
MLKLVQQTLVGQSDAANSSGVFLHPFQEILLLYSVSSSDANATFISYCQEQFEREQPQSTLEIHQLLERCVGTAQRMEVTTSLICVGVINDQTVLAAYRGSIWLKRGNKVGQIVSADEQLQLLEGRATKNDMYVMFTKTAEQLHEQVQKLLPNIQPQSGHTLIENSDLLALITNSADQAAMGMTIVSVQEEEHEKKADVAEVKAIADTPHEEVQIDEEEHISADVPMAPVLTEPLPPYEQPMMVTPAEIEEHIAQRPVKPHPLKTIAPVLANFKNITSSLSIFLRREAGQLFSQDIYVRRRQRKSLGRVLIIGLVMLLTVTGAFVFLRGRRAENARLVATALQPIHLRLDQIRGQVTQNPVVARQETDRLIQELETQSQDTSKPKAVRNALVEELEAIRQFGQNISGQEEFPVLPTFFDLRLVQSNFLASAVDVTDETLFFLDSGQRKILALNIERKQPTILPIGEYPDIRAIVADDRFLYFLGEGLFRFTLSGTEVATLVENADDTIRTGHSLGVFGSYVYVLNKTQNNIFRYTTNDDQLDGKPSAWVQAGEGFDFATVQNFAIDGDIWLGTQVGEIKKFASGRQEEFTVAGLPDPLSSPVSVFTKPDMENLYVLEPQKSRVVILNKNGEFLREIKSSTLAASTAIAASEKSGKIFALSGSLVFEIGL